MGAGAAADTRNLTTKCAKCQAKRRLAQGTGGPWPVSCKSGGSRMRKEVSKLGMTRKRCAGWRKLTHVLMSAVVVVLVLVATPRGAFAEPPPFCAPTTETGACGAEETGSSSTEARPGAPQVQVVEEGALIFYWGAGCPHCEEAKLFVRKLEQEPAAPKVRWVEVRENPEGRACFLADVERLGISAPGIPMFVRGDRFEIGFQEGTSEERIRTMLREGGKAEIRCVDLPFFGEIDPRALPLSVLTMVIGLVDGINPCAMYVLVAMLGILLHVKSRKRMLLFGGTFVVMSGVVYFMFMSAWLGIFTLSGIRREVTIGLGVLLIVMGLINLKELVWFKKGVSLMIPEKAKPGLFRRMRRVAAAASLPAAALGIAGLAFVVNLVELGCTLGLPAVYTRILSLRGDLSSGARYAYLALYNVAYVVPLALILVVYTLTLHRLTLSERGAKVLKSISGVLLVVFGLIFVLAPELLQ